MHICSTCQVGQPPENFHKDSTKKSGLASRCRPCVKAYRAGYYRENSEALKAYSSNYVKQNRAVTTAKGREWRKANRERHLAYRKLRFSERYREDANFACVAKIRAMLRRVLKATGKPKDFVTFEKIGYTADQLLQRLSVNFTEGMCWANFGRWEIDHRIPIAHFVARGETRPEVINALSNLVPKWREHNRAKGARYVG